MSRRMKGIVAIVQEGRFQLRGDDGVFHLFVLGPNASADTAQLMPLQKRQARIEVTYVPARNMIGNVATSIKLETEAA